jgi:hypothetical protein
MSRDAALSAEDADGRTPLHAACANGNARAVVELIRCGANLQALDHRGQMPLQLVADAASRETISLMATLETSDRTMRRLLSAAAERSVAAAEADKATAERAAAEAMAGMRAAERAAAEAMVDKAVAEAGRATAERAVAEAMVGMCAAERAAAEAMADKAVAEALERETKAAVAEAGMRAARDLAWIGTVHAACKALMVPQTTQSPKSRSLTA